MLRAARHRQHVAIGRLDVGAEVLAIEHVGAEEIDVGALTDNVVKLVPLGLRVSVKEMYDKIGLREPEPDEEVLEAPAPPPAFGAPPGREGDSSPRRAITSRA